MSEKKNLELVPRPPRAVVKIEPGGKQILSGMVTDTLALVRTQPDKPPFLAAICGDHGGLDELLAAQLQNMLSDDCAVELKCFAFTNDLIRVSSQKSFDLVFGFLNPTLRQSAQADVSDPYALVARLTSEFQMPIIVISNGNKYGQGTGAAFLRAGAGAFLGMPFKNAEFRAALVASGITLKN